MVTTMKFVVALCVLVLDVHAEAVSGSAQAQMGIRKILDVADESFWSGLKHAATKKGSNLMHPPSNDEISAVRAASQATLIRMGELIDMHRDCSATANCTPLIGMSVAVLELGLMVMGYLTGASCWLANFCLFIFGGLLDLMVDEKVDFFNAVLILLQHMSSVGYGTHPPKQKNRQLWHGVSAVFGYMMVNDEVVDVWRNLIQRMRRVIAGHARWSSYRRTAFDVVIGIVGVLVFTGIYEMDQRNYTEGSSFMDAMYLTLMTFSTVGYGDLSPKTWWGQLLGVIYLSFGPALFAELQDSLLGKYAPADREPAPATYSEWGIAWQGACKSGLFNLKVTWICPWGVNETKMTDAVQEFLENVVPIGAYLKPCDEKCYRVSSIAPKDLSRILAEIESSSLGLTAEKD